MKKKLFVLFFIFFFFILSIQNVNGYSSNIEGKKATWEVVNYDVDAFSYIKEGSKISIEVINATQNQINVFLLSTDFVEEENLIKYTESRCSPFIESPSFLNESNDFFQEIHQENLFGVVRNVAILIIQNTEVKENSRADFILKYDLLTGLLIEWKIIQYFGSKMFQTIIELTFTNFWKVENVNKFKEFYITNKYWILSSFTFIIGILGIYIISNIAQINNTAKIDHKFLE